MEANNFKSKSCHCVTLGKALNLSGFCLLQRLKQVTYWRIVVRFKWHNDNSSTPIYSIILYQVHFYTNRKKCMTQEFFHSDPSMYATRTLQLSFFFCVFMPRKKNTTTNMSEESLGNMHISLHIISKIIQSILGYPPEQLLRA